MDEANHRLAELAKQYGFAAKRNCYCRKKDDGILQFIKFEYEQRLSRYELRMGLYSLYSELKPHWLTPGGCILRYPVIALSTNIKHDSISPSTQVDALQEYGLPWLDAMHTQRNLVDAICEIEMKENGKIMWHDSLKLAPFLASEDYFAADRVISSILQQHVGPAAWTHQPWVESDFNIYRARYPDKDSELIRIHEWIRDKDNASIISWLQDNWVINSKNLKF